MAQALGAGAAEEEEVNPRIRLEPVAAPAAHKGLLLDRFLSVKASKSDSHAGPMGAICAASPAAAGTAYKLRTSAGWRWRKRCFTRCQLEMPSFP